MHVGLSLAEEGDILVTTFLGTNAYNAIWGELATCAAVGKNMKGVVADGAIRDIRAVREMNFPVWGRTVFSRRSSTNSTFDDTGLLFLSDGKNWGLNDYGGFSEKNSLML